VAGIADPIKAMGSCLIIDKVADKIKANGIAYAVNPIPIPINTIIPEPITCPIAIENTSQKFNDLFNCII
jgi:hypothetical protein|tara:strand:- start:263 stop:472 length:210 start_codon:yes stop_codon:yes gene_type:complete